MVRSRWCQRSIPSSCSSRPTLQRTGLPEFAEDLRAKGAALFSTEHAAPAPDRLPILPPDQPDADAVCLMQSFYALAIQLAARRGTDADRPRHLQKVTRTR